MAARAVTIGTFDGFHLGHRHLADTLAAEAALRSLEPLAITFDCHPLAVLRPGSVPPLLGPRPLTALPGSPAEICTMHFDSDIAAMTARQFMQLLRERYNARLLLMGFNNRIGSDGPADFERYRRVGASEGIEVAGATPLVLPGGIAPSSSAIRKALGAGDADAAAAMLGRPYALEGTSVPGKQNGRVIGFPTINLHTDPRRLVPAPGVYAGFIVPDAREPLPAVINVGRNPTVGAGNPLTVEGHAIDSVLPFDYGRGFTFLFAHRLRDERRFGSLDELKTAIAADVEHARRLLQRYEM